MISFLKGNYIGSITDKIIINIRGVGYGVWVADKIKNKLKLNSEIELYIYTHVREDALELFGFTHKDELSLFQLLLGVSGVGPKSALLIVDRGVPAIQEAIVSADVSFFTSIPRIGKKNAQKIIIDLKSKLGSLEDLDLTDTGGETLEIVEALQAVGFSKKEAFNAVRRLPDNLTTLEEKMRYALKSMQK